MALIAAVFMMVTLMGLVLICAYPLAHEKRNAVRHHATLERYKDFERGAYGRHADQPGGKFNACGGYFSDTGLKVRKGSTSRGGEVGRMLEFWFFKDELYAIRKNYRYDEDLGFWVGYRGKRYIVRTPGEERMRYLDYGFSGVEYTDPMLVDGYRGYKRGLRERMHFKGYVHWRVHFMGPTESARKDGHSTLQFNPVDRLEVRIRHVPPGAGTLSTELIYARQSDDRRPYKVDSERGDPHPGEANLFVFQWKDPDDECPGSTFQSGLKKLVIYEDGDARLTRAICIPPIRKFRSKWENEIYRNVYRVDVDYE
jgi:hypothetical protein